MHATETSARRTHATALLAEADRLMTVCNSCRYCEGLCAVFPAMEMRRAFSDGDLNYLANLCHDCGACYVDCQFSPPHEFDVNVPQTLAQVRAESYAAYAWPRAFAGAVRAQRPRRSASSRRSSVAAFIFGFAALHDRQVLFGIAHRPGRVLPADAAQRDGGAVRRRVPLRDRRAGHGRARVLARHRRAGRHAADAASLWQAIRDAGELALSRRRRRRLLQRGRAPDRPAQALSSPDLLRLPALLRRRPAWRRSITICSAREAPYPWWDLPVVLGTLGGIGLSDRAGRPAGRARCKRDPVLVDEQRCGMDVAFIAMLFLTSLTGLALLVLRATRRDGAAARAASRRGVRAVHHHALRQVRARPLSLRRAGALCAGAQMMAGPV